VKQRCKAFKVFESERLRSVLPKDAPIPHSVRRIEIDEITGQNMSGNEFPKIHTIKIGLSKLRGSSLKHLPWGETSRLRGCVRNVELTI